MLAGCTSNTMGCLLFAVLASPGSPTSSSIPRKSASEVTFPATRMSPFGHLANLVWQFRRAGMSNCGYVKSLRNLLG